MLTCTRACSICKRFGQPVSQAKPETISLFVPTRALRRSRPAQGKSVGISNIKVESFTGLLTDFARQKGASFIIRGLRAVSDFEYEFQMASANKRLKPDLETVFLTASESQHFVASSLVKEIARYGGDISSFVPIEVSQYMAEAFSDENS